MLFAVHSGYVVIYPETFTSWSVIRNLINNPDMLGIVKSFPETINYFIIRYTILLAKF